MLLFWMWLRSPSVKLYKHGGHCMNAFGDIDTSFGHTRVSGRMRMLIVWIDEKVAMIAIEQRGSKVERLVEAEGSERLRQDLRSVERTWR
jgi:hypothetical protein